MFAMAKRPSALFQVHTEGGLRRLGQTVSSDFLGPGWKHGHRPYELDQLV